MMEAATTRGAGAPHGEPTPISNDFGGKVNAFPADVKTREEESSPALAALSDVIGHPEAEAPDREAVGMLRVKTANQWMQEAAQRPDPKPLWRCFWYEGEVCCLFSDSNLGKSIYGVQIAADIANSAKVIYFDFELSDKQFQLRYTDTTGFGDIHRFPDNFLRCEIDPVLMSGGVFEERIVNDIEEAALRNGAKVIIIDNLTWIESASEKGEEAAQLMMRLMQMKRRNDFSILVVAHTPKRDLSRPISQNDLAGSKKLFNFFDSCFTIGRSAKDESLRYIKQIKVRHGAFEYGGEKVLDCEIAKDGDWLHFRTLGVSSEAEHLMSRSQKDDEKLKADALALKEQGRSLREIADTLHISKSKAERLTKK